MMADIPCPYCALENALAATIQVADGSRVCRKCGHIIAASESMLECRCIRCWQQPIPPVSSGSALDPGM